MTAHVYNRSAGGGDKVPKPRGRPRQGAPGSVRREPALNVQVGSGRQRQHVTHHTQEVVFFLAARHPPHTQEVVFFLSHLL